jgi:hypothetical protein
MPEKMGRNMSKHVRALAAKNGKLAARQFFGNRAAFNMRNRLLGNHLWMEAQNAQGRKTVKFRRAADELPAKARAARCKPR